MAIRPPIDAASSVSAGLSAAIEALASDPQRKQPPTLADVRADLQMTGFQWSRNGELLHPQDRTSLLIELDGLIAQYDSVAGVAVFFVGEVILSRLFYRLRLRDRPY